MDLGRVVNALMKVSKANVLYRTVASCSGLESLKSFEEPDDILVLHGPPRSSLTNFSYRGGADSACFVNCILAGHADTLEDIIMSTGSGSTDTTTADLMAALPRLRSLQCDNMFLGLEAVAKCKTLRDVSIALYKNLGEIEMVEDFLREANQLQRVHLVYCSEDYTVEYLEALVEAMGSSRRSRVERLCLEDFEDVRPLVRALPSLPALRHLDVTSAPLDDELLLSITPATAPALRRLELVVERDTCPHAWIHRGAVRATLIANTSLHIQLCCRVGDECDCETCSEGCHREVKWEEENKIGLFSHDPDKCPSPEDHADDIDWQRDYAYGHPAGGSCTWMHT
ncbi:uncharacterized protein LOC113201954 [Frankliniella occidentalis]|uniref:Uncharacterized protein LOC113201954 n=1 Tax=Frankliniella occidentalis TaxID=133901 RepID=A0A6J1RTS5_FRAOC|nr:uncharacterized protein LOC113201954 [Frankliniella occidentalis]